MDWYLDVKEQIDKVYRTDKTLDVYPDNKKPTPINQRARELKVNLIKEEVEELLTAISNDDLVGIADGAADSIVVILGAVIAYGIDLREVWDEVHRTNMAKQGGKVREDGKRLKPEGWTPPRIKEILDKQSK